MKRVLHLTERKSETYIEYFKNLSTLENEMIIFTSSDLKPEIEKIREGKRTTVVTLDINNKFKNIKKRISNIQESDEFKSKIEERQLRNPEYWSADYVLVCNLKSYFIKKPLTSNLSVIKWLHGSISAIAAHQK